MIVRLKPLGDRCLRRRMRPLVWKDIFATYCVQLCRQDRSLHMNPSHVLPISEQEQLKVFRTKYIISVTESFFVSPMTIVETGVGDQLPKVSPLPAETSPTASTIFPMIWPTKAAELFEDDETGKIGQWPIFVSTRAIRDLRRHRTSGESFNIIKKKIWLEFP